MAQEDLRILHDTYAALQRAQREREKQLRSTEREAAGRVVESYGKRNGWPDEDIEEVKGALGLKEKV